MADARRRFLLVLRLYSGFEQSIRTGQWRPSGAPTIYRLIEALERRGSPLQIALAQRTRLPDAALDDRDVALDGLRTALRLLAPPERLPGWLGRFRGYLAELGNVRKAWGLARRFRPDIVYVDRGSLWIAGILCRFTGWPVVYRVMGVSDALTSTWRSRHPLHRLDRWLLQSPFAAIICSQDGSGGEVWLPRLFRPGVPVHMMLNGVDWDEGAPPALYPATGKTRVGFVGRLEDIKGSRPFVAAFLRAWAARPGKLQAILIGDGPERGELDAMVAAAGAQDDVLFVPSLPHRDMRGAYESFDIYVSLNRQGNLSNANLEAFAAGRCSIVPRGDAASGRDVALDALFPADSLLRIESPDDEEGLARTLVALHDAPGQRAAHARETLAIARRVIPSWDKRIADEMGLLDALATGRGPAK